MSTDSERESKKEMAPYNAFLSLVCRWKGCARGRYCRGHLCVHCGGDRKYSPASAECIQLQRNLRADRRGASSSAAAGLGHQNAVKDELKMRKGRWRQRYQIIVRKLDPLQRGVRRKKEKKESLLTGARSCLIMLCCPSSTA